MDFAQLVAALGENALTLKRNDVMPQVNRRDTIRDALGKLRIAARMCLFGLLLESQMAVRPTLSLDALAGFFERLPAHLGPTRAPVDNMLRAGLFVVQLARLLFEAFRAKPVRRHQDVNVKISVVTFAARLVHGEVNGATVTLDQFSRNLPRHVAALVKIQARRKRQFQLTVYRAVDALVCCFRRVPELPTISDPLGPVF